MDTKQAVINRILNLCEQRNITVNRLCASAGVTQSTINDIVNGVTRNAGIITIKKLCDGLDITLTDFFNDPIFKDLEQEIK